IAESLRTSEQVVATTGDAGAARRWLAGEASGVVVQLPAGIGNPGEARPVIRLHHAPRAHLESRWAEGIVTEVVLRELARSYLAPLGKEVPLDHPFVVERHTESAGGALSVNAYSHSFCGMTLQYLLFWGMDSGLLLLRQRRLGIWRRLRTAPVTQSTLLAGKALATAMIALALMAVTLGFGAVVFQVT